MAKRLRWWLAGFLAGMAWASWRRERLGDLSRFAWRFVISLVEVVMEAARRAKREPEETSLVELEGVARASSPRLERGAPRLALRVRVPARVGWPRPWTHKSYVAHS